MMDSFGLEHVFTQKERFTVHPEGALNVSWIVFGVLLIIYEFFLIPYHIAFEYCPSPQEDAVNAVIVTFFIADIFFNFNVGFFDSPSAGCTIFFGVAVLFCSRKLLISRYLIEDFGHKVTKRTSTTS